MSYMAGLVGEHEPHIFCNVCGQRYEIREHGGMAPSWFRNRKAPLGWGVVFDANRRMDYCPMHLNNMPKG